MRDEEKDLLAISLLEETLVLFWNKYVEFIDIQIDDKNKYIEERKTMFMTEVASKIHDIQGRLSILRNTIPKEEEGK